jgi:hypothetical protein
MGGSSFIRPSRVTPLAARIPKHSTTPLAHIKTSESVPLVAAQCRSMPPGTGRCAG